MLANIAQYSYQIGPWNQTNSLIVPLNVWGDMQFQFSLAFYGAAGLGLALGILVFIIYLTPASNIIGARLSGGRALIAFRRDGTYQIKGLKHKKGFLFAKDGIHQVLPGAMHYCKGLSMGACWEESGTAMPVEMAAAMGVFAKLGIPDAETLELFNFFLKDPDQFTSIMTDESLQNFELLPSADMSGTFAELLEHVKEVYAVTDNKTILAKFQEIRRRIPMVEDKQVAQRFKAWRLPYWYNKTRGLVSNVMGTMLSWTDIKNFQIYHQHPAALADIVDDESSRKARKGPKQNAMLIIVAAVVIIIAVVGMFFAFRMMGMI